MNLAPIILFAYNRPIHVLQALNALANNKLANDSTLFIYVDGLKDNATQEDIEKNTQVKRSIRSKKWCKEVNIIEREKNWGLGKSIITGVTEVINEYGKVIVLEDDVITSIHFLQYMNDALNFYENNDKIISIGSWNYFSYSYQLPETFLLPIIDTIAWATWKRAWNLFEIDASKILDSLRKNHLIDAFNIHENMNRSYENMLNSQINKQIDSWGIRWHGVAHIHQLLTLYPRHSLSKHIGFDTGTYSSGIDYNENIKLAKKRIKIQKINIETNLEALYEWVWSNTNLTILNEKRKSYLKDKIKFMSKSFLKLITPPILVNLYRTFKPIPKDPEQPVAPVEKPRPMISWNGNYTSWEEAKNACTGYEAGAILEKVKNSVLKVKNGEAVYERDSFIFDKIQYSWALLAILFKIAIENKNELSILDFGGSLGSSYFQNKEFLRGLNKIQWSVVEQSHFVDCGKKEIADEQLNFYYTIEECIKERSPNILLLSGVIQCLDKPDEWIGKFLSYSFDYIIIDRTAFINDEKDRLTIQEVHEPIYEASYPTWFFNEKQFLSKLEYSYQLISDFNSGFTLPQTLEDGKIGYWSGYILKKWES